jgi:hypothetical protein
MRAYSSPGCDTISFGCLLLGTREPAPSSTSPTAGRDVERCPETCRHDVARHHTSAPGRNRTCDTRFRKPLLYPLSYEGELATEADRGPDADILSRGTIVKSLARMSLTGPLPIGSEVNASPCFRLAPMLGSPGRWRRRTDLGVRRSPASGPRRADDAAAAARRRRA